jgi:hypothetical protein
MSILLAIAVAAATVAGMLWLSIRSRSSAVKRSDADEVSLNEVALNHEMDEFVRSLNASRAA